MNIIELILDEQSDSVGIEAISVVENPAIEEDFVALNTQVIELKELNKVSKAIDKFFAINNKCKRLKRLRANFLSISYNLVDLGYWDK